MKPGQVGQAKTTFTRRLAGLNPMNNTNTIGPASAPTALASTVADDLATLKQELLKAEVRLAKARATVTTAEIEIKVLNTRLRAIAK